MSRGTPAMLADTIADLCRTIAGIIACMLIGALWAPSRATVTILIWCVVTPAYAVAIALRSLVVPIMERRHTRHHTDDHLPDWARDEEQQ